MAVPYADILPLSGDTLIDVMTTGYRWDADTQAIRFSLSSGFNGEIFVDPAYITAQMTEIFQIFGSYIAADFAFAGQFDDPTDAAAQSDINLALDGVLISENANNFVLALGFFPNVNFAQAVLDELYYPGAPGDIYININSIANAYSYDPGAAGFSLLLHEIGHTLGLKHPHDDGGTGRPTFEMAGIGPLDIDWLTVMSYDDDYDWNDNSWDPATPMILDVIALQYLYGPNLGTNAGDNIYKPEYEGQDYQTIFDASGDDRLDLSGYGVSAHVELPSIIVSDFQYAPFGLFTSIADIDRIFDGDSPEELNWLLGTIEEVIGTPFADEILGSDFDDTISGGGGTDLIDGGWGDDTIFGDSHNDLLLGGDGNDTISGGAGDDLIEGGAGNDIIDGRLGLDTALWWGNRADYYVRQTATGFEITDLREDAPDGKDRVTGVETFGFLDGDVSLAAILDANPAPPDQWRLYARDGFKGDIGGNGRVFGTTGSEDVSVLAVSGMVTFDASFSRGNDIIRLSGAAAGWKAALSGSFAVFTQDDRSVAIPVGTGPTQIVFGDGMRVLRFDGEAVKIGSQTIDETGDFVTAPSTPGPGPSLVIPAVSDIYLLPGGEVTANGPLNIFGTADGAETVSITYGDITLDPSFARGGDTLLLNRDDAITTGSVSGSFLLFTSLTPPVPFVVRAPIGTVGMDVFFDASARVLRYDAVADAVLVGSQVIPETGVGVTLAPGSPSIPTFG